MKTFLKYMLILSLFAVVSCLRDSFEPDQPCPCEDEKDVTFHLALPYTAPREGVVTRSIGAEQENAIATLDVLVFKVDDKGVETFQYRSLARRISGNADNSLQTVTAKLRVKDDKQRFVLISNARSRIETLIESRPDRWVGQEKESMLQHLIFELESGKESWKAISASNYTTLPMWGETEVKNIQGGATVFNDKISMLRMVAKIEVELDTNTSGLTSVFQLTSVHVYNTHTSGRIVPNADYINDMKAEQASLPAPPHSLTTVVGPVAYNDFSAPGVPNVAMKGVIYLFETAAKNGGNPLEETCIVVGGKYDGGKETFYRLNIFAADGDTHLDILRNHLYRFNITAVKGPGYATVDEAFRAKMFNMEANIYVWDENILYLVFNSHHMLGVNRDPFILESKVHDATNTNNILKVMTDYPTGWTASVWNNPECTIPVDNDPVSGAPWLTIDPLTGAGGALPDDMHLLTTANTGEDRTAYILFKAGTLTYVERVEQLKQPKPIFAGITTYTNVMYDFQHQKLYAYHTLAGNIPDRYQWQISTSDNDAAFSDIDGATSATYTVFTHFTDSYPTSATNELYFRCILSNADDSYITPHLSILFISTTGPEYGTDANGVRYVTLNKGGSATGVRMALLNLGASGTGAWSNGAYKADNNGTLNDAADLGDFYQWGRVADGHEKIVWQKDNNHVNTIEPMTGGGNTSAHVAYSDWPLQSYTPYNPTGLSGQIRNGTHGYGSFIKRWGDWGEGNDNSNSRWGDGTMLRPASGISYPANDPCPSGWRVPSRWDLWDMVSGDGSNEQNSTILFDANEEAGTVNTWTYRESLHNAVGGVIVSAGAAKVFLPANGYRKNDGTLSTPSPLFGMPCFYWSSTADDFKGINEYLQAYHLYFHSWFVNPNAINVRTQGNCVRCIQEIQEEAIITLSPDESHMPTTIVAGTPYAITVTCKKPNGADATNADWTLHSADPAWCKLAASPGTAFGSASASISGKGTKTVYVIASNNTGNVNSRSAAVYVDNPSSGIEATVVQWSDPETITDSGTLPEANNYFTYVGAFWKANETGERIIRINAGNNTGAWTANVMWLDDHWNNVGDGVALSTDKLDVVSLAARGISFTSAVPDGNISSAEAHPVTGNAITVTGTVATNGYIMFRIGLGKKYTSTPGRPARYAVVLLSYANNTKHQKLYLRQGEEPDYVMLPGDPAGGEMNSATRPDAKKFAAYNLTATKLNAEVPYRGGKFVDYPTQAGAVFKWGSTKRLRWAWDNYNTNAVSWDSTVEKFDFWSPTTMTVHEVSPTGFRRPYEGSVTAVENNATFNGHELKQSLALNPMKEVTDLYIAVSNSVWGYYADGFFDRRQIVKDKTTNAFYTSVSSDNEYIAHAGRLFFNPLANSSHYNASTFFPAAGARFTDGKLFATGRNGKYITASIIDQNGTFAQKIKEMSFGTTSVTWASYWNTVTAYPIRPVVDK